MAILRRVSSAAASSPLTSAASGYTRKLEATSEHARLASRLRSIEQRLARLERGPQMSIVTAWGSTEPRLVPDDSPVGALAYDVGTKRVWISTDTGWRILSQLA
jgi:hypothetical protein